MYRHAVTSYVMRNSLPSPEYTGDSDSDTEIIQELEQKRRQLDEEVARFKAKKDKEFRDFETEVRSRRRNKKSHAIVDQKPFHNSSTSLTPPSQTGFREKIAVASHSSDVTSRKAIHPRRLMKSDFGAKANSPTLCLDKLNIVGENTSNQHPLHTPPTPSLLSKIGSQSSSESLSNPSHELSQNVTRGRDESSGNGMFDPSYLPFLEAKLTNAEYHSAARPLTESHTEPTSPNGSLPAHSAELHSSSLPSENHVVDDFHLHATKRAYTAPSGLRRNPLAPIIRKSNDRKHSMRKRKRVTFQLADRAIVDPSSSYEEGPSPSLESDRGSDSSSSVRSGSLSPMVGGRKKTPRDQFGRRVSDDSQSGTKKEEVGMGMGDLLMAAVQEEAEEEDGIAGEQEKATSQDDGYFSPKHGETLPPSPLYVAQKSPDLSENQEDSTTPNSFDRVDDDRYLSKRREKIRNNKTSSKSSNSSPPVTRSSPSIIPARTQPRFDLEAPVDLGAQAGNVGFFELDEELTSPGADNPVPFSAEDIDDKEDASVADDTEETKSASKMILPNYVHGGIPVGFAAGSVPIDIIRPGWSSSQGSLTSSWIGTFGH